MRPHFAILNGIGNGQLLSGTKSHLLLLRRGDVELEVHDVAVLHHVRFAFLAVLACCFHFRKTGLAVAQGLEVFVGAGFGLDEAPLEVGVNHARRAGGHGAVVNGPGPHFVVPAGEVVDHVELLVARLHHPRQGRGNHGALAVAEFGAAGFGERVRGGFALVFLQGVVLLFELDGNRDHRAAPVSLHPFGDFRQPFVALLAEVFLGQVDQVHDGLGGDDVEVVLDQIHL